MELSSDWKSFFPLSSVFKPPFLLADSKPILGPLFFNPKPKTLSVLFSSPFLPNPPPPFLQTHNLLSFQLPPSLLPHRSQLRPTRLLASFCQSFPFRHLGRQRRWRFTRKYRMSLEKENTKAFLILNENYTHIQGGQ
ncbi:uncharacterized protein LOC142609792 [Castanea sativa]|uniref:uncharacterized protein LOC142609792 n=1 Tax=Castanea sativa TaxID=21020 RepID=UPI003F64C1E5